jgi:(heptosyl)LPS beta-1,4-glucosyltransferase
LTGERRFWKEAGMKLSATVMSHDSIATLPRCLSSLEFCDEIVVVDDASTDGTWEFLQTQPKVVALKRTLDTFSRQRAFLKQHVRGAWMLIVDADEEVSPALADEIRRVVAGATPHAAFRVPMKNLLPAHWTTKVHYYDHQKRLLRADAASWPESSSIHAPASIRGSLGRLRGHIVHHSFDSLGHLVRKQLSYAESGARALAGRPSPSGVRIAGRSLGAFFKFFVVKGLFRFGAPGLIAAVSLALQTFLKLSLRWEQAHSTHLPQVRQRVPTQAT